MKINKIYFKIIKIIKMIKIIKILKKINFNKIIYNKIKK